MSLADQQWCPTSVQVTVLQARGLRIKGKSGTNDAYALMQVGKEKYQTSVVEKSVAPVWKEEAAFDLSQLGGGGAGGGSTLHVHVLHRALVGPDKLLGQAVIDLLQLSEDKTRNKTEWFKLLNKTGKADKDRGEVLVDIQFMRNNMTVSMFDLSAAGKSRSRLGKLKDKVRGKKKESDAASNEAPSFTQVLTDSEDEGEVAAGKGEKKKKHKMKSLFSSKSNLQKNMSQSMTVLPGKNGSLSGSQSSGLNVEPPEGKKKFKFMIHKRSGSSDSKASSSGHLKHGAAEQSNVCINGSHIYCEEPQARTSRIDSNFSLTSSGLGSMEDVPDSSLPSVDSLRPVGQYSPWTEEEEEEEEETARVENSKVDEDELRREERIRLEEEERKREEEKKRRREEQERRRVEEEEKRQREEAEAIRMQEARKRKEEEDERVRRQEERRRQEEQERMRVEEEEKRQREEAEAVRMQEARKRKEEEDERVRRQEEERRRQEEQEQMRVEEEEKRQREEAEMIRMEEARKRKEEEDERVRRQEEKRRQEEQERMRVEEEEKRQREEAEIIRMEEARKRKKEEDKRARRQEEEKRKNEEQERRIQEEEARQREEVERIRVEERAWEEEERARRRREEEHKLAEEKRIMEEEEERRIEANAKREEEERIMKEEEERAQDERKRQEEEERARKEEHQRIQEEKWRVEEQERRIEENKRQREEEERIRMEEERRKQEEEARARKQEHDRKLAEEKQIWKEEEERRIEEERVQKEEEERIRREVKERAHQEEEERARREEKKRLDEEEQQRRKEEKVRQEEEERVRREEERVQEEMRIQEEEIRQEKVREEKRKLEEEERRRMEEAERKIKEEEEKAKREKEEYERLLEEKRVLEEQERRRIEEEEKMQREEEEIIRLEKERTMRQAEEEKKEAERIRKEEKAAEEAKKLAKDAQQKKTEKRITLKVSGLKPKVQSSADVSSTNPFDEDFSINPFEENPNHSQQRSQSAGSKAALTDAKDLISSQREKRLAPQPPGKHQAPSQREHEGSAQVAKQSEDKDVKIASVPPQKSARMTRSPTDAKKTQSLTQSGAAKGAPNGAKQGKRPAPLRPLSGEEGTSSETKGASLSDGKVPNECHSEAKQEPIVHGLNPFEDDENELTDDATAHAGSIQGAPAVSQSADDVTSQAKVKPLKKARAPSLPANTAATLSTSADRRTNGGHDTAVAASGNGEARPCAAVPLQETRAQESQTKPSTGEKTDVKKEGPPAASRRLQPVKPLNPLGQQAVSAVPQEVENGSTGKLCEVQEKPKVNDTRPTGPYSQLTREELISLVLKQEKQLSGRDRKISELELYIDNLLVRVIEEQPSILMSMNSLKTL